MTARVHYHDEPEGWWAESPDIDGWTVVGQTYEEVRWLAEGGVTFALAGAAEDDGEEFEEQWFANVAIEHHLPGLPDAERRAFWLW